MSESVVEDSEALYKNCSHKSPKTEDKLPNKDIIKKCFVGIAGINDVNLPLKNDKIKLVITLKNIEPVIPSVVFYGEIKPQNLLRPILFPKNKLPF